MRNSGKLVRLTLINAVALVLSARNKAEQVQPESYVSLKQPWSWPHRTLWPTRYADATGAIAANSSYLNGLIKEQSADDAWPARKGERPAQRRRACAEHVPAGAPHSRDTVPKEVCHVG